MSDEFAKADACTQAEWVRKKEVSPRELVDAAIERIEAGNPELNAVIHPVFEKARERANDPDLPAGPFRGVPFLMKDLGGEQEGEPHHLGMAILKEAKWIEPRDSHFARRSREAGLVCLGRTNTPEIGLCPVTEPEAYGATRSPWNPDYSAGGSSGGSAAAVAAGFVAAAHASDGGGSIRLPASMSGLVGLKPSRARISFGPGAGERWAGFSAQFCVTRSVRDTAALLDVFAGPESGDPYAAPPSGGLYADQVGRDPGTLRVGFMPRAPRDLETHPECVAACENTARLLEDLGHRVEEAHPEALDDGAYVGHYVNVVSASTASVLDVFGQRLGKTIGPLDVEPLTAALAERGRALSAPEYIASLGGVHALGRGLATWWDSGFDILLTPSLAEPPPKIGWVTSTREDPLRAFMRAAPYGVFTMPFNMSGQPAISLPLHWTGGDEPGLPIGSHLVAAAGREDLLLRLAAQLETAQPFASRRPERFG
jgi:amidase